MRLQCFSEEAVLPRTEGDIFMKQFIVLISTIVLGLAIALMIMGFKSPAKAMADGVTSSMSSIVSGITSESAIKADTAFNY